MEILSRKLLLYTRYCFPVLINNPILFITISDAVMTGIQRNEKEETAVAFFDTVVTLQMMLIPVTCIVAIRKQTLLLYRNFMSMYFPKCDLRK